MTALLGDNRKYVTYALYAIAVVAVILWLQPLAAEKSGNQIIQRTISGIMLGGIYSLIALGIVVINKASGVFNFAHGGMMMISAFIFFTFFTQNEFSLVAVVILSALMMIMLLTTSGWDELKKPRTIMIIVAGTVIISLLMTIPGNDWRYLRGIVGGLTGTILIGLTIERFTIRPLIGQPIFAAVMVTLALAEILDGVTKLIWGAQPKSLLVFAQESPFAPGSFIRLNTPILIEAEAIGGNIIVDVPRLLAFGIALAAFAGFFLFFRFTNIGLAMRATSEDQQLAESVGLPVRVILAVTWGIAAVLAGIAGIMYAGSSNSSAIDTNLQFVALRAFPAVLLGGLESISGALIGGLVLGLTEEWAKMLFTGDVAENLAPYLLLMIVLVLRPEGLFGEKRIERI